MIQKFLVFPVLVSRTNFVMLRLGLAIRGLLVPQDPMKIRLIRRNVFLVPPILIVRAVQSNLVLPVRLVHIIPVEGLVPEVVFPNAVMVFVRPAKIVIHVWLIAVVAHVLQISIARAVIAPGGPAIAPVVLSRINGHAINVVFGMLRLMALVFIKIFIIIYEI